MLAWSFESFRLIQKLLFSETGAPKECTIHSRCLEALSSGLDFFCGNTLSTNHGVSWLVMIFFWNLDWFWDHPLIQVVPGAVIALHPEWGRTAGVWVCSVWQMSRFGLRFFKPKNVRILLVTIIGEGGQPKLYLVHLAVFQKWCQLDSHIWDLKPFMSREAIL